MGLMIDSLAGVLTFRVLLLILFGTGIALAIPMTFILTPTEGLTLLGTI